MLPLRSAPLGLVLPTDNDAIFSPDPSGFYMYTDRNFEGVLTKPWSGGGYGFTRDQKRTAAGIILTRLHEGVDIRPVKRDAAGEPLDEVRSIADGTVVYVNGSASRSNYGRYIVVHHDWGDGPFFLALRAPQQRAGHGGAGRQGGRDDREDGIHRRGDQPGARPRPSRAQLHPQRPLSGVV